MSDWIEWYGGERPVDASTMVEVRFVNGWEYVGRADQFSQYQWRGSGHYDDIVSYRVVPQNPVPEDTEAKTGVWISTKTTVISEEPKPDAVNHPSHYTDGGIETIDFIEAKLGPEGFLGFCLGNALKYISRAGKKDNLEQDLSKAIWYLKKAKGE